ncbi:MAG: hypothetical protein WCG82_10590 [Bacteroidota bacterium]
MDNSIRKVSFFLILLTISLFLTFIIHQGKGQFNWQSEIWADRAGYYIYLPSFFMYHFDAKKCPEKIEEKTGYGFMIDREKNTINTKYTYGVAALLLPFFLASYVISPILHIPGEAGFGLVYHKIVNVAAVIYLIFGLLFLKKFLAFYFKPALQYVILFFIYAGTNLLFYTIDDTLMSHVYSFFLFSVFLVMMKKILEKTNDYRYFLGMSITYALIILIRPTNAVILVLFFLWDAVNFAEVQRRIRIFLKPKFFISFCAIVFLVFLPQMIYWKYSRGEFLVYSYRHESFSNWNHPKLLEVWFSTLNGLFLYTPMVLFIILGMLIMIVKRIPNGILTLIMFFFISYVFASWYNWYFGCGFGQRSYVEFYAIFAIPFGHFIRESFRIRNLLMKSLGLIFMLFFCYYNVRMILTYNKCFFGSTWDWVQFGRQLERNNLFTLDKKKYSFENDMENNSLSYLYSTSDSVHVSGMYSAKITSDKEYAAIYSIPVSYLGDRPLHYINFNFWAFNPGNQINEALVVCSVDKNDTNVVWQSQPLAPIFKQKREWQQLTARFVLTGNLGRDPIIKIYFWNPKRSTFFVDDLKVEFD